MSEKSSSETSTMARDLDRVLYVLENPIRRKIIQRLSEEPAYPLQLSKELDVGQQLVTKHLRVMERAGIVAASYEPSPAGPTRKVYSVSRHLSMSLSFGSNLFSAKIFSFERSTKKLLGSNLATPFLRRIEETSSRAGRSGKLRRMADVIADIDKRIEGLEKEKAVLLNLRSSAMDEASEATEEIEMSSVEKRILHYVLNERDTSIERISTVLDMRESFVAQALKRLEELLELQ